MGEENFYRVIFKSVNGLKKSRFQWRRRLVGQYPASLFHSRGQCSEKRHVPDFDTFCAARCVVPRQNFSVASACQIPYICARMNDTSAPKLVKWPFLVGDLLLLTVAAGVAYQHGPPMSLGWALLVLGGVTLGAWLGATPFLVEYRARIKFAEANQLSATVDQIKNLQAVGDQISAATGQWQTVQELSAKTVSIAKAIGERIATDAKAFAESMQKASDAEKAQLRLEVEKLRRGEGEWLQAMVRLLDHVYALHQAAARSKHPGIANQLAQFQHSCREIVRRLGIVPFEAGVGERFDTQKHQLLEAGATPPADALISDNIATGYHFQGQLVRRAIVKVKPAEAEANLVEQAKTAEAQLSLGDESSTPRNT